MFCGKIRRPLMRAVRIVTVLALVAGCAADESTAPDGSPAASSASSAASQTASASASAAPAGSLEADHIFGGDVAGFAFVELPKSLERRARRQFESAAGLDDDEAKLDVRSLTLDGTGIGVVLVVTLSPEYAALPGTEEGFATGMAESAGVEADEIDLGATEGYVDATAEQTVAAWQDDNLLVAVIAEQRTSAMDAARAIVKASG